MCFRYQCRSVAFSLNGWRDASLINKNRFFFPQMDLREWFSVDLRLVKQSRRWHLFILHFFPIFIAHDKLLKVEYKCSSSPSNPGATLKWETHDAHDGTKSSTAILVLFCFFCSSCLSLSLYFQKLLHRWESRRRCGLGLVGRVTVRQRLHAIPDIVTVQVQAMQC